MSTSAVVMNTIVVIIIELYASLYQNVHFFRRISCNIYQNSSKFRKIRRPEFWPTKYNYLMIKILVPILILKKTYSPQFLPSSYMLFSKCAMVSGQHYTINIILNFHINVILRLFLTLTFHVTKLY